MSLKRTLWVLCLLLIAGCGADASEGSEERLRFEFFSNSGLGLPISGVEGLRVTVVNPEDEVVLEELTRRSSGNQSSVSDLPHGDGLTFLFEALDADDSVLATGGTRPINVSSDGSGVVSQYVFMLPLGAISPVSALFGGASGPQVDISDFTDGSERAGHATVVLADGRVLVIGGASLTDAGQGLGGSEYQTLSDTVLLFDMNENGGYFDPISDGFEPIKLSSPRAFHTATVLEDGSVLIAGGVTSAGQGVVASSAVERLVPLDDGGFEVVSAGNMGAARVHHTATSLGGDAVLLAGGESFGSDGVVTFLNSAEVFDGDRLSLALTMNSARAGHSATQFANGQALLCGGRDETQVLASCELFQGVSTAQFVGLADMATPRSGHVSVELPGSGGRYTALIGGFGDREQTTPSNIIEFFDSSSAGFDNARRVFMSSARAGVSAVALGGSDFLVVGGESDGGTTVKTLELFRVGNSGTYQGAVVAELIEARHHHQASMLPNGMVLITGGARSSGGTTTTLTSNEIYNAGLPSR